MAVLKIHQINVCDKGRSLLLRLALAESFWIRVEYLQR